MLIISTGSNQGDKLFYLNEAKKRLSHNFKLVAESKIFESAAVDYLEQPPFYNQLLQFELPAKKPDQVMSELLSIEKEMGRIRDISKGPRTIDLDIIFWGTEILDTEMVNIPHPSWYQRSFIVLPLLQLPYSKTLQAHFTFPQIFDNTAKEANV